MIFERPVDANIFDWVIHYAPQLTLDWPGCHRRCCDAPIEAFVRRTGGVPYLFLDRRRAASPGQTK
jgi:hypothetical protein